MADYVILTDSSTDLTKDLRERFGIDIISWCHLLKFQRAGRLSLTKSGRDRLPLLIWEKVEPAIQ